MGNAETHFGLCMCLNGLANAWSELGRPGEAEQCYTETIQWLRSKTDEQPARQETLEMLAIPLNSYAVLMERTARFREALEAYREAAELRKKLPKDRW